MHIPTVIMAVEFRARLGPREKRVHPARRLVDVLVRAGFEHCPRIGREPSKNLGVRHFDSGPTPLSGKHVGKLTTQLLP